MTRSRYLSTGEAAERARVAYSTIDTWRRRGLLTPAIYDGRKPRYRVRDVLAAERVTRRSGTGRPRDARRLDKPQIVDEDAP